jgi:hypothetical protein
MTYQLDVFGNAHPIKTRVVRPTWQPKLFGREHEAEAEAEAIREALERFRAAGNRGDDEPPECEQ